MKKILLITIGFFSYMFLYSCKETCNPHGEYDFSDVPALNEGYNSCTSVYAHFYYESLDNTNYPYYSNTGDTIRCCGYVVNTTFAEEGAWVQFLMADSPGDLCIFVECDSAQFNAINTAEKCYVTGCLYFDINTDHFTWLGSFIPGECVSPLILIKSTEMHN